MCKHKKKTNEEIKIHFVWEMAEWALVNHSEFNKMQQNHCKEKTLCIYSYCFSWIPSQPSVPPHNLLCKFFCMFPYLRSAHPNFLRNNEQEFTASQDLQQQYNDLFGDWLMILKEPKLFLPDASFWLTSPHHASCGFTNMFIKLCLKN